MADKITVEEKAAGATFKKEVGLPRTIVDVQKSKHIGSVALCIDDDGTHSVVVSYQVRETDALGNLIGRIENNAERLLPEDLDQAFLDEMDSIFNRATAALKDPQ